MFLLHNNDQLNAFGWAFGAFYEGSRFERPTADDLRVSVEM